MKRQVWRHGLTSPKSTIPFPLQATGGLSMNCESLWTYENNQIRIYSVFTCQIKCTKLKLRQCSDKNSLLDLKRCFHFRGINLNNGRDNHLKNGYLRSCHKLSQLCGLNDRKGQRSRSPPTFDKFVQLSLPFDRRSR